MVQLKASSISQAVNLFYFNASMVQLKEAAAQAELDARADFNASMVQLKGKVRDELVVHTKISMPAWFN